MWGIERELAGREVEQPAVQRAFWCDFSGQWRHCLSGRVCGKESEDARPDILTRRGVAAYYTYIAYNAYNA